MRPQRAGPCTSLDGSAPLQLYFKNKVGAAPAHPAHRRRLQQVPPSSDCATNSSSCRRAYAKSPETRLDCSLPPFF